MFLKYRIFIQKNIHVFKIQKIHSKNIYVFKIQSIQSKEIFICLKGRIGKACCAGTFFPLNQRKPHQKTGVHQEKLKIFELTVIRNCYQTYSPPPTSLLINRNPTTTRVCINRNQKLKDMLQLSDSPLIPPDQQKIHQKASVQQKFINEQHYVVSQIHRSPNSVY